MSDKIKILHVAVMSVADEDPGAHSGSGGGSVELHGPLAEREWLAALPAAMVQVVGLNISTSQVFFDLLEVAVRGRVHNNVLPLQMSKYATVADHNPDIVWFSMHARNGWLQLPGGLSPHIDFLRRSLKRSDPHGRARLLVLSACDTEASAHLLADVGLPVIGTCGVVRDEQSVNFLRSFLAKYFDSTVASAYDAFFGAHTGTKVASPHFDDAHVYLLVGGWPVGYESGGCWNSISVVQLATSCT